jgi:hypothetical protein
MPNDGRFGSIVHPGPFQRPIGEGKAARFDDIDANPKACSSAQDGANIPGNLGLIQGNPHRLAIAAQLARCDPFATGNCLLAFGDDAAIRPRNPGGCDRGCGENPYDHMPPCRYGKSVLTKRQGQLHGQ